MIGFEEPEVIETTNFAEAAAPVIVGENIELTDVRTVVSLIRPAAIGTTGNRVKITVRGPKDGDATISEMYIGLRKTEISDPWQFETATAITWGGNAALGPVTFDDGDQVSDEIDFIFDGSRALLIAAELPIGSRVPFANNLGDNFYAFAKDGVSEASSTTKGEDYTPFAGFSFLFTKLEGEP